MSSLALTTSEKIAGSARHRADERVDDERAAKPAPAKPLINGKADERSRMRAAWASAACSRWVELGRHLRESRRVAAGPSKRHDTAKFGQKFARLSAGGRWMQTFTPASASCLDFGKPVISWRYLQARTPPPDAAEAFCDHCGLRVHRASAGSARRRDRARGSARGCPPHSIFRFRARQGFVLSADFKVLGFRRWQPFCERGRDVESTPHRGVISVLNLGRCRQKSSA